MSISSNLRHAVGFTRARRNEPLLVSSGWTRSLRTGYTFSPASEAHGGLEQAYRHRNTTLFDPDTVKLLGARSRFTA